jgi:chemotaxis protein MotB
MLSTRALPFATALCLLATACGPSQDDLDAELARNRELQAQLDQAATDRAALEATLAGLHTQNTELTSRLRALGQNVEEAQAQAANLQNTLTETQRALEELRERERQAQARLETFRQLLSRFRDMIASGRLRVRVVRNRMVVELPEGVLFDSGRSELKPEGQETLRQVAAILRDIPEREFQVAGHTDNIPIRGRADGNWQLSTQRAVTVTLFLSQNQVPTSRISAVGYADTQPVTSNDTPEGRAQNRRIEIVLVPRLDELPDLSSLEGMSR